MSLDLLIGRSRWHIAGERNDGTIAPVCGASVPEQETWHDATEVVFDMDLCGNCDRIVGGPAFGMGSDDA